MDWLLISSAVVGFLASLFLVYSSLGIHHDPYKDKTEVISADSFQEYIMGALEKNRSTLVGLILLCLSFFFQIISQLINFSWIDGIRAYETWLSPVGLTMNSLGALILAYTIGIDFSDRQKCVIFNIRELSLFGKPIISNKKLYHLGLLFFISGYIIQILTYFVI